MIESICQPGKEGNTEAANGPDHQGNIQEELFVHAQITGGIVQGEIGDQIHGQQFGQT